MLDRQLQDTIYQFEHKTGVVEKIPYLKSLGITAVEGLEQLDVECR